MAAGLYLLIGTGFYVMFRTLRFFCFTYGILITLGAYFSWTCVHWLGFPLWCAIITSLFSCVVVGCLIHALFFQKLSQRIVSPTIKMVSSLALYIVFVNIISLLYGDQVRRLTLAEFASPVVVRGIHITSIQLLTAILAIILWLGILVWLRHTRVGAMVRATACDPGLVVVCGTDRDGIELLAVAVGAALASIAGAFVALDVGMQPTMGLNGLMMSVIVAVVAGSHVSRILLAALLLGIAQHMVVYAISSQWQDATAFIVLLIFLMWQSQRVSGGRFKMATL